MNPLVSWGIFITVLGAIYLFNQQEKRKRAAHKAGNVAEKTKSVFLNVPPDQGDAKKKAKKAKKKAAAPATTATKDIVSTADEVSDGEGVAQELKASDVAKRLQAIKAGGNIKPAPAKKNLAASHSPLATASQSSSTGADADIDEEESTPLAGSSTDPRDMLEPPAPGPSVLRIGPPTQPPRQPKKAAPAVEERGIHATKNDKKKEKKKAEKEAARADQKARFEQHRQAMRADTAAQQKSKPAPPPSSSAWSGKKEATPEPVTSGALLDTFVPQTESEDDVQKSTLLGDSWESVPAHVQEPEPEWNEVKRKSRKEKRAEAAATTPEPKPEPVQAPPPQPPKPASKPAPKKEVSKAQSSNSLQEGSTGTASDTKTTSGSDWSRVDDLDMWAVHPESDY